MINDLLDATKVAASYALFGAIVMGTIFVCGALAMGAAHVASAAVAPWLALPVFCGGFFAALVIATHFLFHR